MSDFLETIGHAKRLNSAVKDVSTDELKNLVTKIEKIIQTRIALEEAEQEAQAQRLEKIEALKQQMAEEGITAEDLSTVKAKAVRKKREPRPPKYAIMVDGEKLTWTGQGRMPNAFKNSGQPIENFLINK